MKKTEMGHKLGDGEWSVKPAAEKEGRMGHEAIDMAFPEYEVMHPSESHPQGGLKLHPRPFKGQTRK